MRIVCFGSVGHICYPPATIVVRSPLSLCLCLSLGHSISYLIRSSAQNDLDELDCLALHDFTYLKVVTIVWYLSCYIS